MKNQRRKFTAGFKAKVALDAIKERESLSELAVKYEVSVNQISLWKNEFKKNSSKVFESNTSSKVESSDKEKEDLYQKIGKLEMEKEYLKKNLKRLGLS